MSYWGYHLILDCSDCNKTSITDPDILSMWVRHLVYNIDMVSYGDPQIVHFGHNEDHLAGWTVIQLIETSNIIAHFCDKTGEGYIDIFSCKEFDIDEAVRTVEGFFHPTKIRKTFLTRQAD
jgi:S-adenosylmethionine/arginine decarboxylase-like enzyme